MPFYNHNNGDINAIETRGKKSKAKAKIHSYAKWQKVDIMPRATYFSYAKNIAQVYNFPTPIINTIVIGVISLGGGLFGTVNGNILTNGDVQAYWTSQGITSQPTVAIVSVSGGVNNPAGDLNSTIENTIDVETIGSCCPGSNVIIIMYIAPNSFAGFYNVFNYAFNTPVSVNSQLVKPSVVSCSWGTAEANYTSTQLSNFNTLFRNATSNGINICCASGDNGSSDGLRGLNVDFPGSSPYVTCCGGTTLTCPTLTYSGAGTTETAWSGSGGGLSRTFNSPTYQTNLQQTKRSVPDIAMDADPSTGVMYLVNNTNYIVGGTSIVSPAMSAFLGSIGYSTFFNMRLYSLKSSAFHDIVSGSNGGYRAKGGYDNVTGLGSINGQEIKTEINNWIAVTSVSLNFTTKTIPRRTNQTLTPTVLPANATNNTVVWKSSNTTTATVNQSGVVSALRVGTTTITATTNDGWLSATCSVTVI